MSVNILVGDCRAVLATLPAESVQTCVSSPPYFGLRSYGIGTENGELGREPTPDEYVAEMVGVFRDVRRVLRDDATLWLNIGDSYNAAGRVGHGTRVGYKQGTNRASASGGDNCRPSVASLKEKDLIGIPWMLAFALRADGWYLRQECIWHKPNPMPESVQDRCTKAHESVFLLTKRPRYFFDAKAIAEPGTGAAPGNTKPTKGGRAAAEGDKHFATAGNLHLIGPADTRNRRSVWTIATQPFSGAHFATMPPALAEICIKAGSRPGDMVLDPFFGAGTTGLVADRLRRSCIGIELNPAYATLARERIAQEAGLFASAAE